MSITTGTTTPAETPDAAAPAIEEIFTISLTLLSGFALIKSNFDAGITAAIRPRLCAAVTDAGAKMPHRTHTDAPWSVARPSPAAHTIVCLAVMC
jgi:hypothetical protein